MHKIEWNKKNKNTFVIFSWTYYLCDISMKNSTTTMKVFCC
jgi:hypothetical protein